MLYLTFSINNELYYTFMRSTKFHPQFTDGFVASVRALEALSSAGDNAKDAAFTKFYEQYGTHYLSEARFGAKLVVQTRMSKSEVHSMQ